MTRATFFKHFELLTDQPDAVAKMRGLIVELAVRGKLVEPNSIDEPASKLVDRLAAIKNGMVKQKQVPAGPALLPVNSAEVPFHIPRSWLWVRLGALVESLTNGIYKHETSYADDGIGCLRMYNIKDGKLNVDNLKRMRLEAGEVEQYELQEGDLLVNRVNSRELVGKAAVVGRLREPLVFESKNIRVRFLEKKHLAAFVNLIFRTQEVRSVFEGNAKQTCGQASVNQPQVANLLVAIPPLAEQRRIVAKVDELMAFCDELEQRQQARQHASGLLQQSALHHLLAAREPQTFAAAWQRVRNQFHLLHDTPDAIPQLRQAILQLAVQGRLGTQDAKDQPSRAVTDAADTSSSLFQKQNEPPFNVPSTWQWKQLGQVSDLINGDRSKNYPNKEEYVPEGVAWINTGHIEPDGTLSLEAMHYITRAKFESLRSGKIKPGDLVYCLRGATLGKTAIISQFEEGAVASSLVIIRLSPSVYPKYAYSFLTSPLGRQQIWKYDNGSAQPNLSADSVKKYWIPLPPLAEQKRIVARVEELLRWCDTLEAQLHQTRTLGAHLLDSTLHHLLAA